MALRPIFPEHEQGDWLTTIYAAESDRYEAIFLERREINEARHIPEAYRPCPRAGVAVAPTPSGTDAESAPATSSRRRVHPSVERRESLRDMSKRMTGKRGRNA